MNIAGLKKVIENLPNDMEVFVGCQGYTNFDFIGGRPYEDSETQSIIHENKLFLTDYCAIDDGTGNTI